MKPYKRKFKEENSLDNLKDPKLVDMLVDFIRENPFPRDHEQLHKWAEGMGYDPDVVEEYAYAMLTLVLCGGKSKGKEAGASQENFDIGYDIEIEHVSYPDDDYDTDHPVIERMQEILVNKISNDHLFEDSSYYKNGVNFLNELEKENK